MNNTKLKHFKNKLLKEKEEQKKYLKEREEEKEETIDSLESELSSYDNHPADIGTEVYMMEQEKGYKEQIKETIEKINDSLESIEEGNYGICNNCNKEIKEKRLELIPYTKTCLDCSNEEKVSNEESLIGKKKYESLNYESINLEPNEEKDNVSYDREDTYQDVMQDNIVPKDPSHSTGDNIGIMDEDYDDKSDTSEDIEKISEEYYKDTLE
ncbi:MAG: TraR/DksA C4-type zinc finger protein [Tissierella sp.]|uniref:TraR/DksA C4-type zinc finger protein n=1 Tax=Tissierella sp. TaxID=41274 RepID=UPI003F95276E